MGTVVQVDVCMDQNNDRESLMAVYRKIWERLEDISWRMSVFDVESDVSRINTSKAQPVVIGKDTYKLIQDAKGYSLLTQGAFDITVWPLISLWKQAQLKGELPTQDDIDEVKTIIGTHHIQLMSDERVLVKNGSTQLDLGGIAKGYAVDEVARILRSEGINNFFIDAGGDIFVGGMNCKNELWKIGIRDPRNTKKILHIVELTDRAVTTSGNYEQYFEIDQERFSHIIDPETGYPQEQVVSATVIAPTAQEADVLSTALCVLGEKKGVDLINSLGESFAGVIVEKDKKGKIKKFISQEYERYLQ